MDEHELKHVIALLLEDAKRLQQIEPNAGTEARIWIGKDALESGDYADPDKDSVPSVSKTHGTKEDLEIFTIKRLGKRFYFSRSINGVKQESYAPVDKALASVYAVAYMQGYEPPKRLGHTENVFHE